MCVIEGSGKKAGYIAYICISFVYVCVCVCVCVCVLLAGGCGVMCMGVQVLVVARRGHQILWSWNYKQLRVSQTGKLERNVVICKGSMNSELCFQSLKKLVRTRP